MLGVIRREGEGSTSEAKGSTSEGVPKACKGKGFYNVELKAYVLFELSRNQNRSLKISH